jgi:membrane protein implicated in regulation of membrane protease activity
MLDQAIDYVFSSPFGWFGVAAGVAAIAVVLGYLFPQVRIFAAATAAVALFLAVIYTKGAKDQKAKEEEKKAKNIAKTQKKYDEIERRNTSAKDVEDRLRKGTF